MKTAIITGITGQDGAYLAKLLLEKEYKVIGVIKNRDNINLNRLKYLDIANRVIYEKCDLNNLADIINTINKYEPDEIYNLAAQSAVGLSFSKPLETLNFNILSVANLLEAIKLTNKKIKYYQASSSEMFGNTNKLPLTENSNFYPVSPYGISKASSHWITVNYRESFGLFACSGILFNHESVLRGSNFIIKKIIKTALDIVYGRKNFLEVGNIDIRRDFGYAPEYVKAMYLMLQHESPDDYIIASGKSLSIREIIYYVFDKLNISRDKVIINYELFRPNEIKDIYGDASKARDILKWNYNLNFFEVLDLLIKEEENIYEKNLLF